MTTSIQLTPIGSFATGVFDEGAAEIPAYDPESQRLFVVNAESAAVDVLDLSDPTNPVKLFSIDVSNFGGAVNSVAVKNGIVALAVEDDNPQSRGRVVFTDIDGNFQSTVRVGALPDSLTFTPDGQKVLVANEGEPNDDFSVDPTGSISIIDISRGVTRVTRRDVTTADFITFNFQVDELKEAGVRIFGPNASVAQDLEPEFIAVSADSTTAWVTLQENNALAVVDIEAGIVTDVVPLGVKDHSLAANALDASDRDDAINITNWPVFGLYQPDGIASFEVGGQTYLITANEGDGRDFDGFSEEERVEDLTLDPVAFPDAATLQAEEALGRLLVTTTQGDTDGDGDFDQLFSFGGRSFSIWDTQGNLIFDSGDDFEQITASLLPENFNSNNDSNGSFDNRSDNSGPEPEGVTTGVVGDRIYAFIGLERIGGVMVYDVTEPTSPSFVQYINPRDFSVEFDGDPTPEQLAAVGDLGPEGLIFISAENSPNGVPLLVVANEVSGSTTVFEITTPPPVDSTFTLQLLHASDQEAGVPALVDAPNFSAVLNALKTQDADGDGAPDYANTLVLSSGDAYIPSPFLFAGEKAFGSQGRGDILIQNELGFQAISFGNHEFDLGTGVVADLIAADGDYPGTLFPYLSSNLDFSTDSALAPLVTADGQEASEIPNSIAGNTIITINGERIGVVGATTPTLRQISSPGGVTVLPPDFDESDPADIAALAAEIQTSVDTLLTNNPDINKVILLAHMQQIAIEEQLAELLTDVDIIIAGGSNTLLADETDRLRAGDTAAGPYPILSTAADGNPIAVVNTDGNYTYVGRLVVEFDSNGVIIPDSIDPTISGAYATDEQGVVAVNGTPDPEIVAIAQQLEAVIIEQDGNIFGASTVFLNGSRTDVRTQETNLGNLTADANLAIAKEIDPDTVISIKNGGGIRDNIGVFTFPPGSTDPDDVIIGPPAANPVAGKEEGEISQLDITNALRFNNGLSLLTLTAEQLLAVIEHGVSATAPGATPGRFPQVAGLSFSFDPDLPVGDRVLSLAVINESGEVIDIVAEDGEVVGDPARTFRTVTLDFLAGGGDGYPFPTFTNTDRIDLVTEGGPLTGEATFAPDGSEQDAFAEFLADNFSVVSPFSIEDVPPEGDTRIQNLNFREDTVLAGIPGDGSGSGGETPVEEPTIIPVGSNFLVIGTSGDDELVGDVGNDTLLGAEGDDAILGFAGDDTLSGGPGDDLIRGFAGNDVISGDEGADGFIFASGEGFDTIIDFTLDQDQIILLSSSFGGGALSVNPSDEGAVIAVGDENLAILSGVSAELVTDSSFFIF